MHELIVPEETPYLSPFERFIAKLRQDLANRRVEAGLMRSPGNTGPELIEEKKRANPPEAFSSYKQLLSELLDDARRSLSDKGRKEKRILEERRMRLLAPTHRSEDGAMCWDITSSDKDISFLPSTRLTELINIEHVRVRIYVDREANQIVVQSYNLFPSTDRRSTYKSIISQFDLNNDQIIYIGKNPKSQTEANTVSDGFNNIQIPSTNYIKDTHCKIEIRKGRVMIHDLSRGSMVVMEKQDASKLKGNPINISTSN